MARRNKAGAALDAARKLASQWKFGAALRKHVWFHNHALKVRKSYYGVRLSYALAYWIELGEKYPPALVALRRIRDRKAARLAKGNADRGLFHDVESINNRLGEPGATVALFKRIDKLNGRFASAIYDLADEALISQGEYALARKHLVNPSRRFEIARRNFEEGMEYVRANGSEKRMVKVYESIFREDVKRIVTVLEKTGERGLARKLKREAAGVLKERAIKKR